MSSHESSHRTPTSIDTNSSQNNLPSRTPVVVENNLENQEISDSLKGDKQSSKKNNQLSSFIKKYWWME